MTKVAKNIMIILEWEENAIFLSQAGPKVLTYHSIVNGRMFIFVIKVI